MVPHGVCVCGLDSEAGVGEGRHGERKEVSRQNNGGIELTGRGWREIPAKIVPGEGLWWIV